MESEAVLQMHDGKRRRLANWPVLGLTKLSPESCPRNAGLNGRFGWVRSNMAEPALGTKLTFDILKLTSGIKGAAVIGFLMSGAC